MWGLAGRTWGAGLAAISILLSCCCCCRAGASGAAAVCCCCCEDSTQLFGWRRLQEAVISRVAKMPAPAAQNRQAGRQAGCSRVELCVLWRVIGAGVRMQQYEGHAESTVSASARNQCGMCRSEPTHCIQRAAALECCWRCRLLLAAALAFSEAASLQHDWQLTRRTVWRGRRPARAPTCCTACS